MSHRLPRNVQLKVKPARAQRNMFSWELRLRSGREGQLGQFMANGTAESRSDAREQAWEVCESCGLVVDS